MLKFQSRKEPIFITWPCPDTWKHFFPSRHIPVLLLHKSNIKICTAANELTHANEWCLFPNLRPLEEVVTLHAFQVAPQIVSCWSLIIQLAPIQPTYFPPLLSSNLWLALSSTLIYCQALLTLACCSAGGICNLGISQLNHWESWHGPKAYCLGPWLVSMATGEGCRELLLVEGRVSRPREEKK